MLKAAKVRFGGSVVDALVLDFSPLGVRISTETFIPFSDTVIVELRSGGTWEASLRWQRGLETGFAFERFRGLAPGAAIEAAALLDRLRNAGVLDVTAQLAEVRYYDHAGLQAAAEAAEAAVRALESVLHSAAHQGAA